MGVNWTKEQQEVIDTRESNILVSAAAGSGKTAVLVERIITRLTKDENPINIDELLIVTFTEAAAAEMKERILDAIEKALENDPTNMHLKTQTTLIHNASITTIHSFCMSVIKSYFYTIDLDPVFRVGEEGELVLLQSEVLESLLEEQYSLAMEQIGQNQSITTTEESTPQSIEKGDNNFLQFVETFATGKSDYMLSDIILSIYTYSRSYPQPKAWLEECAKAYGIKTLEELNESYMGVTALEDITQRVEGAKALLDKALELAREEDGPEPYLEALVVDEYLVNELCRATALEEYSHLLADYKWTALSRKKGENVDPEKKEQVKFLRDSLKDTLSKLQEEYFEKPMEEQLQDIIASQSTVEEIVRLVGLFGERYEGAKRKRNLIDFGDMEQYAMRILNDTLEGELIPSVVAKEYQEKFAEVMIDEYQDSNLIQEAILGSVSGNTSGRYNMFMVGDVKQSIYRFRLSRPELFMEKFHKYTLGGGRERRIDLHKNFRSRAEVLDPTNHVFYKIMNENLGGVEYNEDAALYVGAAFNSQSGNQMELRIIDESAKKQLTEMIKAGLSPYEEGSGTETTTDKTSMAEEGLGSSQIDPAKLKQSTRQLEARDVARRMKELVGHHMVVDKATGGFRPAEYSDMVILTRSLAGWSDVFADVLGEEGIPVDVNSRGGYFKSWEIALLMDYLRVIDNPMQDIPLAAILTSMFGGVTSEELAVIHNTFPRLSFSEAVYTYEKYGTSSEIYEEITTQNYIEPKQVINNELAQKLTTSLGTINHYRSKNAYGSVYELLWSILEETGYKQYVSALSMGEQRLANVEMLLEKAVSFEDTSYKGLFNFIRYVELLEKYKVEYGEASTGEGAQDAVRIMSIHKSKGLEFPIVFVVGMGKSFNTQDMKGNVVIHPELGLGINYIDPERRTKSKLLPRAVMNRRLKLDNLGEELRVLYVAMTRAKEKLILTGHVRDLESTLGKIRLKGADLGEEISYDNMTSGTTYLDWLLPALCNTKGFDPIWKSLSLDVNVAHGDRKIELPFEAEVVDVKELVKVATEELEQMIQTNINTEQELNDICLDHDEKHTENKNSNVDIGDTKMSHNHVTDTVNYKYPFAHESEFKVKVTVSELKKRPILRDEMAKELIEEERNLGLVNKNSTTTNEYSKQNKTNKIIPEFMKDTTEITHANTAASRGNAYHRFMELWDYAQEATKDNVQAYIQQSVINGKLTQEYADYINTQDILDFLASKLGLRMKGAAQKGSLYKEQPFVMGIPAAEVYGVDTEQITLLQGIIDVYFIENNKAYVVDFKTDKVADMSKLASRYGEQLGYYARAVGQLTGYPVGGQLIYSFHKKEQFDMM